MIRCEKFSDLRKMNKTELIERHDVLAKNTVEGTQHYLEEIRRRDSEKIEKTHISHCRVYGNCCFVFVMRQLFSWHLSFGFI